MSDEVRDRLVQLIRHLRWSTSQSSEEYAAAILREFEVTPRKVS